MVVRTEARVPLEGGGTAKAGGAGPRQDAGRASVAGRGGGDWGYGPDRVAATSPSTAPSGTATWSPAPALVRASKQYLRPPSRLRVRRTARTTFRRQQ